jgi:glycosyltransferase involved in cell wall biosynthesis
MEPLKNPCDRLSISVIVAAYNERYLITESLRRLRILEYCGHISRVQVIVVDEGSTDGTRQILESMREYFESLVDGKMEWMFLRHDLNRGKGEAIRTALARAIGEVTVIYDADLEYDAADIGRLVAVFLEHQADAVFGSRFAGGEVRRALLFRHQMGNKVLTFCANMDQIST